MRFKYSQRKMTKLFANSGDPDQTPRSAASDLGLHCLLSTLLRVSRLQWVKSILVTLKTEYLLSTKLHCCIIMKRLNKAECLILYF